MNMITSIPTPTVLPSIIAIVELPYIRCGTTVSQSEVLMHVNGTCYI